ncbi:MAG: TetR/AcrR family transcriptional regulator [Alphaproteobacteria bacterium]
MSKSRDSAPDGTASTDGPAAPTRERIKQVAEDFYVLRGYEGFSFGDIAQVIETTRANIHHHFGNKRALMAELIDGFVADAEARIAGHWTKPGLSFFERFADQVEDLNRFYLRFNRTPGDRNVWSPLSRLRLDLPVLGELSIRALERVNARYEETLRQAVNAAIASGELSPDTPVDEVVRLLRMSLLSCGPMTQDSGSFQEVALLFGAIGRTIARAWGRTPPSD